MAIAAPPSSRAGLRRQIHAARGRDMFRLARRSRRAIFESVVPGPAAVTVGPRCLESLPILLSGHSQSPYMGRYGGAPTAAGWGEDCWTGPPISPPPRSDPSHYSDVTTHMHMSHAPPPEPNRARIIWRT